ncbi:MAG: sulfotransferase family protein [Gammaproteobacteria bacterium]|nr:MAG: sulfotransferase family protein [Gammaproteobacteria bacterium]
MPNVPDTATSLLRQWQQEARGALRRKQFAVAEDCCRKIIDAEPRNPDAHFVLAMLALETNQLLPAAKLLQRAVAFGPYQPEYLAQLARVLVMLDNGPQARLAAEKALELDNPDALTLDTIGCVFSYLGDHAKAIEPFSKATNLEPHNPDFQFNYASSLRFIGDFDAAEVAYENAIASNQELYQAHWSLANLRRSTAEQNHIDRLSSALVRATGQPEAEAFLHNALAKEFDDLGDADTAFQHLSAGKSIARRQVDYSIEEDRTLFSCIHNLFSRERLQMPVQGLATSEPIFIVGMPRTGTTLVERILSSHSEVYSAGELRNFGLILKQIAGAKTNKILDAETIAKCLEADPAQLGKAYIDSTRPKTGHTSHFIDKTPLNFLNIGFIHRALPKARIICVRRNAMDTCLSNFRHMFSPDAAPNYKYSYDLLETGHYYLLFDALMRHWEDTLPGKVLLVQYEDVVANQEVETRKLINFCGLEWEDACLHFEQNAAPVATASSVQVRQPIYSSAAARWKRYAHHLQPLKELLQANDIKI